MVRKYDENRVYVPLSFSDLTTPTPHAGSTLFTPCIVTNKECAVRAFGSPQPPTKKEQRVFRQENSQSDSFRSSSSSSSEFGEDKKFEEVTPKIGLGVLSSKHHFSAHKNAPQTAAKHDPRYETGIVNGLKNQNSV